MLKSMLKGNKRLTALAVIAAVVAAGLTALVGGCGSGSSEAPATTTATAPTVAADTATSTIPTITLTEPGDGTTPGMPNLDADQVAAAEVKGQQSFDQQYGDGSGLRIVWGPNIIGDWALMGVENRSGAGNRDVLMHMEGGQWQVKDIGQNLAPKWLSQTPPELWPGAQ